VAVVLVTVCRRTPVSPVHRHAERALVKGLSESSRARRPGACRLATGLRAVSADQ